ncbi:hypothetical protein H206_00739 [Candidatus Electrothrix aarhusensis]|uniref:FecR family protein n=1 Tax=Candidatus Electrothrix aarhusensis TaxID=1859131 RepID=A0A3S3U830_9BACT|nr:hypothetical protein H206_00739 [Candidatus Electrothrix aarhusensis]
MKKKTISTAIMATILTAGIVSTQAVAGILAEGDISVYKGGNLSNTMTGQNPVDEEALLVCNDKCMIKTTGVSIVGATGTELSVKNDQEQFNLLLKKGHLDFILSGAIGKMGFYTADGQYTNADIIFNASTSTPVRGYMHVKSDGSTKIGVYEGRMVFDTVEGAKTVDSNNYILLAQAGVAENEDEGGYLTNGSEEDTMTTGTDLFAEIGTPTLVGGGLVLAGVAYGLSQFGDDDDPAPSSPTEPAPTTTSQTSSTSTSSTTSSATRTPQPVIPRNPSPSM